MNEANQSTKNEMNSKDKMVRIQVQIKNLENKLGCFPAMNVKNECEVRELGALKAEFNVLAGIKIY